jgi:FKBP-type peptidyl-prolyl cis-trans isomerase (trigger factor)
MPASLLQQQLQQLRAQLAEQTTLSDTERDELLTLSHQIEQQLAHDMGSVADGNLVDGVNLAVERFEVEHPTLSVTLRSIVQGLANMGI